MTCLTPCQEHDPELWFSETPEHIEQAVALCHTCPSEALCAILGASEPFGVWGGIPDRRQAPRARFVGRDVRQPGEPEWARRRAAPDVLEQQISIIIDLAREGMPRDLICKRLGITDSNLRHQVRRAGERGELPAGFSLPHKSTAYASVG